MFIVGAVQFYLSHVPSVLLAQQQPTLPQILQGRRVIIYESSDLETELNRIEAIKKLLDDPQREHFISIGRLKSINSRVVLQDKTWQRLQERYPTQEAWNMANLGDIRALMGEDRDFAEVILKRVREVRE